MRINELILEKQELDEISLSQVGSAIGKGATAIGKGIGGAAGGAVQAGKNFWQGMKAGYAGAQQSVAGQPEPAAPAAAPQTQPAAQTGGQPAAQPGAQPQPAPQGAAPDELEQLKGLVAKLNPDQKKQIASELEKSTSAPPADPNKQSADATARGEQNKGFGFNNQTGVAFNSQAEKDAFKAQQAQAGSAPAADTTAPTTGAGVIDPAKSAADKQAKNAADAAERDAQIAATKQANAAAAQADNDLVAAVKAAKAKPGFQQTAQDKLTIQKGAAKGIHESKKKKKKKIVAEFKSNFLGMVI